METALLPKPKWRVGLFLILILLVVADLLALIVSAGSIGIRMNTHTQAGAELNQIQTAVLAYYTEYAGMPVTSDTASLIKTLMGDNLRGITFLALKASDLNSAGEILDPWERPIAC
jgi:hypothetical protein